jgi:hypothetical protein
MLHPCTAVTGANTMAQSPPIVLALVVSVCGRLDGPKPFDRCTDRALWSGANDGWVCILPAPTSTQGRNSLLNDAMGRDCKGKP